jgi:hypothetical protein
VLTEEPAGELDRTTISLGAKQWVLAPGYSLTFGRGVDQDVRFAHDPLDDVVSRATGHLTAVRGGVLVTNDSPKRSLYLQAVPGPELVVPPLMTVGTMPYGRVNLVIVGSRGARYTLQLVNRPVLASSFLPFPAPRAAAGVPTTSGYLRIDMPETVRRYLAALCEPLLTRIGQESATYTDIALRCGVAQKTVRNGLDKLRQRLTDDFDIPGLVTETGRPIPSGLANFREVLADWAIVSGNATLDDAELLDEPYRGES